MQHLTEGRCEVCQGNLVHHVELRPQEDDVRCMMCGRSVISAKLNAERPDPKGREKICKRCQTPFLDTSRNKRETYCGPGCLGEAEKEIMRKWRRSHPGFRGIK